MPSNPIINSTLVGANVVVQNAAQKILIVAQQDPAAAAAEDVLTENIGNDGEQLTLYGARSPLAKMITAFKKANPISQVDAIGLGVGSTARVHTSTVVGTATAPGVVNFIAGSQRNHFYPIAVAKDDTPTIIAAAIAAAVNADTANPFTAAPTAGVIVFTADILGLVPNSYPIGFTGTLPAGVTLGGVVTTPGAVDPDTSATLDVVGERRYQIIVWSPVVASGTADEVVLFLDARFNSTNGRIEDGVVYYTNVGTLSTVLAANNLFNSENAFPICYQQISDAAKYIGPHLTEHPDEINAYFAGIHALRLTEGETVARFLTTTATAEQFGGPQGASLPFFNTPITEIAALAEPGREFSNQEIQQISDSGGSVFGNNDSDTETITGALVSTYKTLPSSAPDTSFKFLNYRLTGAGIREYFHSNLLARYGQTRLTGGALVQNAAMSNEDSIRAFCVRLYQTLSGPGFILTQRGEVALKFFKEQLDVSLNLETGLVTIEGLFPIVTQLRQINLTIKIAFSTTEGA